MNHWHILKPLSIIKHVVVNTIGLLQVYDTSEGKTDFERTKIMRRCSKNPKRMSISDVITYIWIVKYIFLSNLWYI